MSVDSSLDKLRERLRPLYEELNEANPVSPENSKTIEAAHGAADVGGMARWKSRGNEGKLDQFPPDY